MASNNSFLGQGWHFPPTFNSKSAAVSMVADEEDVKESLQILLSTSLGERTFIPNYGCDLSGFVFAEVGANMINNISRLVSDAILYYEPRIDLNKVTTTESVGEAGLLIIDINYTIRNTNSRLNFVFPFYINEAT